MVSERYSSTRHITLAAWMLDNYDELVDDFYDAHGRLPENDDPQWRAFVADQFEAADAEDAEEFYADEQRT